jgi:hypothetical protein
MCQPRTERRTARSRSLAGQTDGDLTVEATAPTTSPAVGRYFTTNPRAICPSGFVCAAVPFGIGYYHFEFYYYGYYGFE